MQVWIVLHITRNHRQFEIFSTEEKAYQCIRKALDEYEKEYNQKIPDGNRLLEISGHCSIEIAKGRVQ